MSPFYSDTPRELAPLVHHNGAGQPPVVLIVDDEAAILRVVESILDFAGYRVLAASSEEEAIFKAEEFPDKIAVLLSDVVLATGSGPGLAGRIRKTRPDMKVLYMSGYAPEELLRNGEMGGGDLFVPKPLEVHALLKLMGEMVKSI